MCSRGLVRGDEQRDRGARGAKSGNDPFRTKRQDDVVDPKTVVRAMLGRGNYWRPFGEMRQLANPGVWIVAKVVAAD